MSEHDESHAAVHEHSSDECRGHKRSADDEKVHSANEWEKVDLGDEGRKNKFLRLMGASKKDHHGRIVIGDTKATVHVRSTDEVQKLNSDLEGQYRQGLELKMSGSARRHTGLGFSAPDDAGGEISRTPSSVSVDADSFLPVPETGATDSSATDDGVECGPVEAPVTKSDNDGGSSGSESGGSKEIKIGGFVRSSATS